MFSEACHSALTCAQNWSDRRSYLLQVGDAAHDERGALAPAAAFVGSQTLHGLKGDLDHVVEGFKEKNLVQSQ